MISLNMLSVLLATMALLQPSRSQLLRPGFDRAPINPRLNLDFLVRPRLTRRPTPAPTQQLPCDDSITFRSADDNENGATYVVDSAQNVGVWFRRCPNSDTQRCFEEHRCKMGQELPSSSLFRECRVEQRCAGGFDPTHGNNLPCLMKIPCNQDPVDTRSPTPSPTPAPTRDEPCDESITFRSADDNEVGATYVVDSTQDVGVWFRRCPNSDNQRCFEERECRMGMQLPSSSLYRECRVEQRCAGGFDPTHGNNLPCLMKIPCNQDPVDTRSPTPSPTPAPSRDEPCDESITFQPVDASETGVKYYPTTAANGVWFRRCPHSDNLRCFEKLECEAGQDLPSSSLFAECRAQATCVGGDGSCFKHTRCGEARNRRSDSVDAPPPVDQRSASSSDGLVIGAIVGGSILVIVAVVIGAVLFKRRATTRSTETLIA